jgi:hypothetical protein
MQLNENLLDLTNELANLLRQDMQNYYDFRVKEGSDTEEWCSIIDRWGNNTLRLDHTVRDLIKEIKEDTDMHALVTALIAPRKEYLRQTTRPTNS